VQYGIAMNLASRDPPIIAWYVVLMFATSNCRYLVQKFSSVPKVTGKGTADLHGMVPLKDTELVLSADSKSPIILKILTKRMLNC
jgi:hypothetical protein